MPRTEPHRPQFHFTPARHWINDPNGLVWFEGEYYRGLRLYAQGGAAGFGATQVWPMQAAAFVSAAFAGGAGP